MKNWLSIITLWSVIGLLICGVLFSVWARMNARSHPQKVLKYAPHQTLALERFGQSLIKEKPTPQEVSTLKKNAQTLLKQAPLNDEALVQMYFAELNIPGSQSDIALLNETKIRSTRNIKALAMLFMSNFIKNDFNAAIEDLDLLLRLNGRKSEFYYAYLNDLYENLDGAVQINRALEKGPAWGEEFFNRQLSEASPERLSRLNSSIEVYLGSEISNDVKVRVGRKYIYELIRQKRTQEAYKLWKMTLPSAGLEANPNDQGLFNSNFKRLLALDPFNWRLYQSKILSSEFDAQDGLYISYSGRHSQLFARQVFFLKPGLGYVFETSATGQFKADGNHFEWRLYCERGQRLAVIPVQNETNSQMPVRQVLPKIPEGCEILEMQGWALPGQFEKRSYVTIQSARIKKSNAS